VGYVSPGDAAAERTYGYQGGADVQATRIEGRMARTGRSWFSYDLPVDPAHPMALMVTYFTADRRTTPAAFEILVDGQHLADQEIQRSDPARFYDVTYALSPELVRGKSRVTVKFAARPRNQIAAVFGVRMVRADQAPIVSTGERD
jgi:hypothetical protein